MSLTLRTAAHSDLGLRRANNEDAAYAGSRLVAVADGVGGAPAGEWASRLVIATMSPLEDTPATDEPVAALRAALAEANALIRDGVANDPRRQGTATTLTALLLCDGRLALLHVGDSRAYRWRDGTLTQLTRDDTLVGLLVDRGVLTPAEALRHPQRSVVVRAVQGDDVDPTVMALTPQPGDRYLLCSDGLSDVVDDKLIAEALAGGVTPAESAAELVRQAISAGAPDNVTVVIADVLTD